ncbi:transposase [Streptomyces sp. NPDC015127]|uniref:transposase n=1 Tax=Streptomyces sp. NPDC015127 TaxID=3364939 RepID=UPI0036F73692
MGRLPEAWIAPPQVRELRELVRYRAKLVALRSGLKAQVHAVLAKAGVLTGVRPVRYRRPGLAGADPAGRPYAQRVGSLLKLIDELNAGEPLFNDRIAERLRGHAGYRALQQLPGIGTTLAAVLVAEIGDVHRFASAGSACSWAGLTPRHYESDTVLRRGHVTKQGSKLVRWAVVEAIQRKTTSKITEDRARIEARRGRNIAEIRRGPQAAHAGLLRAP